MTKSIATPPKRPVTRPKAPGPKSVARTKNSAAVTAPKPASQAAKPVDTPEAAAELKKQELIAKVVERSGVRKKFAKPVVEAMLELMGGAIAEGREMNLQPFGKLKYNRSKQTPNARIIVAKIRQSKGAEDAGTEQKDTVAEHSE